MPTSPIAPAAPRARRVDAQRNRDALVAAASAAFATSDGREPVSLEAIARAAGVGIGTLYRHFATRDDLVLAVYRTGLDEVCDTAERLAVTTPPIEAMRDWMVRYARFVATKHGMAESLRPMFGSPNLPPDVTRQRVTDAIDVILQAGVAGGVFRPEVRSSDIAAALVGFFLATGLGVAETAGTQPGGLDAVNRMMETLLQGIRMRHPE